MYIMIMKTEINPREGVRNQTHQSISFFMLALLALRRLRLYLPHREAAATKAHFIILARSVAALELVINLWALCPPRPLLLTDLKPALLLT